jgi:uncharacterized protein (DUF1501 family)
MNRAEFLKLSGKLGLTAPFFINGIAARASRWMEGIDLPADCMDITDRVVVIVRLGGANDGLNTVIPISQYDTYANIRPSLRINQTGTGAYIPLDNTIADNKRAGLHPAMTGFKNLYDQGQLAILPGVGYPAPNYSHFASENTMFSGKDGNTNQTLQDGIFGRYLASVFPNLAGNPNNQNRDPLAIHMGSSNPSLFYGHSHETGIEYNITSLQTQFWAIEGFETNAIEIPEGSEHQELLDYIAFVEKSMDVYYDKVMQNFMNGNNSAANYPDTDLGRQLKTVARMLKGGSRTKIFQVTLGGFDTHANQVVEGDAHTGNHANLLANLSNALLAFQTDIETLGFADKVMTVTFSEFGRQVRQNANQGTDHGNISPFFVVGKQVQAGVLNNHPVIPDSGFQYADSERKYDYRQIFATLLQDWLGSDDATMQVAQLDSFATPEQKLPIIKAAAIVAPACYVSNLAVCNDPAETIVAVAKATEGGWTWYAPADYTGNRYLLGIEHQPAEEGGNTQTFSAEVSFSKKICDPSGHPFLHTHIIASPSSGCFVSGYYWNFKLLSGQINGHVHVRFFPLEQYDDALNTAADNYENEVHPSATPGILQYVQSIEKPFDFPADFAIGAPALAHPFTLLSLHETGSYLGYPFVEFRRINRLHQTGMAAMRLLNIEQYAVQPRRTFRFTGNGNFSNPANWEGNVGPLDVLQKNIDIIIDPEEGGQCLLDVPFVFEKEMNVTVVNGKVFVVK